MSQEYKITPIGDIALGIDGTDAFFQVNCDEDIDAGELHDYFMERHWVETYQEAGGYYCKHFEVFTHPIFTNRAVVKVEHRFDV